ncbi:TIGR02301 family protein [Rhizobium sp. ACO-34A]|nr:TIGR02301 family protein [Rhizobium sp. ACO-34A]ATN33731.1 TIGR02301 family protein [Rhizobium sp. ACO-34A]
MTKARSACADRIGPHFPRDCGQPRFKALLGGLLTAAAIGCAVLPAAAQDKAAKNAPVETVAPEEKPAPYDDRLARLSEIMGAVHYLRNLCVAGGEPEWREAIQKLIDSETATEPKRKARMIAAYNRGYRSFASVYTTCTPAAATAEENYRNEGATLAVEIASRFGN